MLNKFWLLLICAILPAQIIICSRQPERPEIYAKVAAMLRGELRLYVTGTTTMAGEPLYHGIPTNHLALTDDCPPGIESTTSEESFLGKGKYQYHTPCFTMTEADALVEQSNIPSVPHRFIVQRFLMFGRMIEARTNRTHCTLSTAAEWGTEPTPLELSYMHKNNDGHNKRVTVFTIEPRLPKPNTPARTESPIEPGWVKVPRNSQNS